MEFTLKEFQKFLDKLEEKRELELIEALPEIDLQVVYTAKREEEVNG